MCDSTGVHVNDLDKNFEKFENSRVVRTELGPLLCTRIPSVLPGVLHAAARNTRLPLLISAVNFESPTYSKPTAENQNFSSQTVEFLAVPVVDRIWSSICTPPNLLTLLPEF